MPKDKKTNMNKRLIKYVQSNVFVCENGILFIAEDFILQSLLNNILRSKANCIGHILKRNCLLHDAIEGLMTEVKLVGRRTTQLLDD